AGYTADQNLQFIPYRKDRLVVVTPAGHPLAGESAVAFADTLGNDYVGLSEWSAIHPFLLQAAAALGRTFKFRVEVGNFEAVCRMIESGVGIGVIPESVALRYARVLGMAIVPLIDEWALRELQICVRDRDALPAFARELLDMLVADVPEHEKKAPARGRRPA